MGSAGGAGLAGCFGSPGPPADDNTPTPTPSPTPEPITIETTEFRVRDRNHAGEPTAEVTFDTEAEAVRVTGTIEGANGCKTAALKSATYDDATDEVSLLVHTVDREGTEGKACTESLVYIDYEATVQFAGGTPANASVSHNGREMLATGREADGSRRS